MKLIKCFLGNSIILFATSCNLLHHESAFEMEELSKDVLGNKNGEGISIQILPIPAQPKK